MERNVDKIKRLEHELGRYRKKVADQARETEKLRQKVADADAGSAQLSAMVDAAILRSLGIAAIPAVQRESEAPEALDTAAVERDIYRRLYEGLLDRMRMDRRETA